MSIKNVVFDFGQVLVRFEPKYMVGVYVSDKDDASLLEEVVFDRLYWDKLDAGTIENEQVVEACRSRLPSRLWDVAEKIYYNWIYNIPEIEGMSALIDHIRSKYGVKVLLLSNISRYFASHASEIPILSKIDKCIFSAPIGIVKPSRQIFEHLCTECDILPEQTIFIDDNASNIAGAKAFGLGTYLFDGNPLALKEFLDNIL